MKRKWAKQISFACFAIKRNIIHILYAKRNYDLWEAKNIMLKQFSRYHIDIIAAGKRGPLRFDTLMYSDHPLLTLRNMFQINFKYKLLNPEDTTRFWLRNTCCRLIYKVYYTHTLYCILYCSVVFLMQWNDTASCLFKENEAKKSLLLVNEYNKTYFFNKRRKKVENEVFNQPS